MKIISFERTVPTRDDSKYLAGECEKIIKESSYKTVTQALMKSNLDTEVIVLRSKNFKEPPVYSENCKIIKYSYDYKKLFSDISDEISKNDEIVIDITHSMRDAAFMGLLLGLLNRNKAKIDIIYAEQISKPGEKPAVFEFKYLTEYINIADFFFILRSFSDFIKIPEANTTDKLYHLLKNFSEAILSNQISTSVEVYPKLKYELENRQNSDLYFLKNEILELLENITIFETINKKEPHESYFLVAKFLYEKEYFLNTSNFLIEALHMYLYKYFKEYIKSSDDSKIEPNYDVLQLCLALITQEYAERKPYYTTAPCSYFIELNNEIFTLLSNLRGDIGNVRHNLSHVSLVKLNLKAELHSLIVKFDELILKNDILKNLTTKTNNERIKIFTKYHLNQFASEIKSEALAKNMKTQTISKKLFEFYENKLAKTDECYNLIKNHKKSRVLYLNLVKQKEQNDYIFDPNLKEL